MKGDKRERGNGERRRRELKRKANEKYRRGRGGERRSLLDLRMAAIGPLDEQGLRHVPRLRQIVHDIV